MKILYRMNSQKYFGAAEKNLYLRQSTFRKPISLGERNKGRVHCPNLVLIPIGNSRTSCQIRKYIDRTSL